MQQDIPQGWPRPLFEQDSDSRYLNPVIKLNCKNLKKIWILDCLQCLDFAKDVYNLAMAVISPVMRIIEGDTICLEDRYLKRPFPGLALWICSQNDSSPI
jgi:hypothetical protein